MLDIGIQELINQQQANYEEYILQALQRYTLFTGDKEIYESLKAKYGKQINLKYSPYLKEDTEDGKIFALYNEDLKPISLTFTDYKITEDVVRMRYTCSCKMGVEIGGVLV